MDIKTGLIMDTKTASVEIGDRLPLENNEHALNMRVFTTAGFSIQGEITLKTAKLLAHELWLAFSEIGLRERMTVAEKIAKAQAHAYTRNDAYVSPRAVRCMHDHCGDTIRSSIHQHPWDLARELGWKLKWDGSDLLCADCVGPKEDCPWKREDHSEAY